MALDMTVDLMSATVQLEQPIANGRRTVATGFLVSDPTPDGQPRVVLITANHVFAKMPGDQATIGYRTQAPDGSPEPCAAEDHHSAPISWQAALAPSYRARRGRDRHHGASGLRQGRHSPPTGWLATTPSPAISSAPAMR